MTARPYHFGPRLRGAAAKALGLLHLTWDKCHGWPALLLRGPKDRPLPGAVQVLVTGYPDYVVAEHRAGRADLVPGFLDMAASAYEAALDEEQGRAHLESGKQDTRPVMSMTMVPWRSPAERARPWLPRAFAAATLLALVWPAAVQHAPNTRAAIFIPATATDPVWASTLDVWSEKPIGEIPRRLVLPDKPLKGQDTPPCWDEDAVRINNGCWVPLRKTPPCSRMSAEYKGGCYKASPEEEGGPQPDPAGNSIRRTR
ncbi:hypothetical protein [Myxococcus eversor]|uniref:hypothetical protein n=1 Tax=Myxococcus eversor TaxID=2709661 RepID=UPI0013D29B01|nr:hypothetical protein [Myxococcus eversor]